MFYLTAHIMNNTKLIALLPDLACFILIVEEGALPPLRKNSK